MIGRDGQICIERPAETKPKIDNRTPMYKDEDEKRVLFDF